MNNQQAKINKIQKVFLSSWLQERTGSYPGMVEPRNQQEGAPGSSWERCEEEREKRLQGSIKKLFLSIRSRELATISGLLGGGIKETFPTEK